MMRLLAKFALILGLFAAVQSQAHGQGMMMRGMGGLAGLQVLNTPSGQQELDLSDDQQEKLREIMENLRSTMMERVQGIDFQNMTNEERQEAVTEIMTDISKGIEKEIKDILNEDQFKRYREISLQVLGVDAFSQAEVAEKLELKDEQKSKFKEISDEIQAGAREAMMEAQQGGDLQAVGAKIQDIREKGIEKALAVLSDGQKETWKEMTGKPFKLELPGAPPRRSID
jgi:Spy/CpxP family protein refolding chaperone